MDLDTPNSFDHYDIYFQDDAERYMRGFETYEQFLALSNQEVGGSGSGSAKKKRTYIPREREEVEQRLIDDYFGDDDAPPKYAEEYFRRMYQEFLRMPTSEDNEKVYALHEEKHRLPRMLESIDCMHWDRRSCPKSLHGQFKRSYHKYSTLMLEAAGNQK
ncbi:RNA-directed DNA polymerase, eukaryota [Tanacetum coccineum]